MNIKNRVKLVLIIITGAVAASCGSSQPVVDPVVRLAYETDPNDANTENLAKSYGSIINKTRKSGLKQPGIYCDYAVALAGMGRRAEANSWFNKEMNDFPSSRQYILQLKKILIPEYQDNNTIDTNEASMGNEEGLSPKTRSEAEKRASEVMGNIED